MTGAPRCTGLGICNWKFNRQLVLRGRGAEVRDSVSEGSAILQDTVRRKVHCTASATPMEPLHTKATRDIVYPVPGRTDRTHLNLEEGNDQFYILEMPPLSMSLPKCRPVSCIYRVMTGALVAL